MSNQDTWPELGEFLVCTIGSVKQNGVYVDLDGYPGREGFIFIGEVASGWVKNIRSIVREGQRVVAKVIKVKKDKRSVELSIKSVSDERRRILFSAGRINNEPANCSVLLENVPVGMMARFLK